MALCVGKFAVPKSCAALVSDDGNFVNVDLADISRVSGGYSLYKWLWEPLGVSNQAWKWGPLEVAPGERDPGRNLW